MSLTWQDPPPIKGGTGRHSAFTDAIQEALRSRPGEWALVHTAKQTTKVSDWRHRYGPEGFEFTGRTVSGSDPKCYDVYARYNPEQVTA